MCHRTWKKRQSYSLRENRHHSECNVGTAMTSPTGGFGKSYESGDQAQPSTPSISEAPAAGFGGAPVIVEPCFVEGCGVGVLRRGFRRRGPKDWR